MLVELQLLLQLLALHREDAELLLVLAAGCLQQVLH
jgi:hypothetical protein